MELYPPCVSCVIRNASRVAERILPEDQVFFAFLRELLAEFSSRMKEEEAAPLLTQRAYEILRSYSGGSGSLCPGERGVQRSHALSGGRIPGTSAES